VHVPLFHAYTYACYVLWQQVVAVSVQDTWSHTYPTKMALVLDL